MMKRHFAVVAPPLPGHWDPLRVLASRLVERGHRVTFVHMADAAPMVAETPFGFDPVGAASHGPGALQAYRDRLARAPRLNGFLPMLRATAAMSRMLLEELPAALERIGADAVIADETEPAGGMAAQRLGLPWITSVTGLPLLADPAVPPPFVGWSFGEDEKAIRRNRGGYRVADLLMRPIRRALDRYGQAWGIDPAEIARGSPLLQVAQCPPGLDFPRRELPQSFRYCGPFRGADQLPAPELPQDGRPLVYCSLGSLQGNRPGLFAAMSQACADLGARAVVAHGGLLKEEAADRLPGDPLVRAFWPQPAVLPHCSAAILHGGFNTVLDALGAGVPMLVVPLAFEQPGTAARVERLGAGITLSKRRVTRRQVRTSLRELLADSGHREAAGRMSAEMSGPGGAGQAADLIEEALSAYRTSRSPARA